jgi:hypothetical protein
MSHIGEFIGCTRSLRQFLVLLVIVGICEFSGDASASWAVMPSAATGAPARHEE